MRRINKGQKPGILLENEDTWKNEYLSYCATGHPKSAKERHRHSAIKEAVRLECFDKCMYCETKLSAAQPGDVEHILPKLVYPHLYVFWDNLGLACTTCNTYKATNQGFVNPYDIDPANHILFFGPFVSYPKGDEVGKLTVDGLRLNRTALMEKRANAIKSLMDKVELGESATSPALKNLISEQVNEMLSDTIEYVSTLRAFHAQMQY